LHIPKNPGLKIRQYSHYALSIINIQKSLTEFDMKFDLTFNPKHPSVLSEKLLL